jgi:hypothetical protein
MDKAQLYAECTDMQAQSKQSLKEELQDSIPDDMEENSSHADELAYHMRERRAEMRKMVQLYEIFLAKRRSVHNQHIKAASPYSTEMPNIKLPAPVIYSRKKKGAKGIPEPRQHEK